MTQSPEEKALDTALEAAFPATDQNYPQNERTACVAGIMAFVAAQLVEAGYDIEYYNFHDEPTKRRVDFNQRQNKPDGSCWVSWHCMDYKSLKYATDAALIAECYKWTLADLRGEILSYAKGEDE